MLLGDPVRADNWDRLLLGMSLFAGDDFDPYEYHPYRDETENEPTDDERKAAAKEIHVARILNSEKLTEEQKNQILLKLGNGTKSSDQSG